MLKLLLITIILYIIIQQLLDDRNHDDSESKIKPEIKPEMKPEIKPEIISKINASNALGPNFERIGGVNNIKGTVQIFDPPAILSTANKSLFFPAIVNKENFANELDSKIKSEITNKVKSEINPEQKLWEFNNPNPWTKVIYNSNDEYPYYFHIKLVIPSLNDYQTWRQVVPNLDFNQHTGELIIPSKDEPSALALANLIVINLTGQMSLENILNKNLIQISITKARKYELVQNKLREQIKENLNGKTKLNMPTSFEKDLAKNISEQTNTLNNNSKNTVSEGNNSNNNMFTSDTFNDTFKHFSDQNGDIGAYDGSDFSYLENL